MSDKDKQIAFLQKYAQELQEQRDEAREVARVLLDVWHTENWQTEDRNRERVQEVWDKNSWLKDENGPRNVAPTRTDHDPGTDGGKAGGG
jgi:hypothetical protein